MRILLAVDESKFSEAAADALANRHITTTASIKVLHIVEPPPLWILGEEPPPDRDLGAVRSARLRRATELVSSVAGKLRAGGATVETAVEQGNPKSKILDVAKEWNADLIILGSHGRIGVERFLLGSVSENVLRHAPCSVEVVRTPTGK